MEMAHLWLSHFPFMMVNQNMNGMLCIVEKHGIAHIQKLIEENFIITSEHLSNCTSKSPIYDFTEQTIMTLMFTINRLHMIIASALIRNDKYALHKYCFEMDTIFNLIRNTIICEAQDQDLTNKYEKMFCGKVLHQLNQWEWYKPYINNHYKKLINISHDCFQNSFGMGLYNPWCTEQIKYPVVIEWENSNVGKLQLIGQMRPPANTIQKGIYILTSDGEIHISMNNIKSIHILMPCKEQKKRKRTTD